MNADLREFRRRAVLALIHGHWPTVGVNYADIVRIANGLTQDIAKREADEDIQEKPQRACTTTLCSTGACSPPSKAVDDPDDGPGDELADESIMLVRMHLKGVGLESTFFDDLGEMAADEIRDLRRDLADLEASSKARLAEVQKALQDSLVLTDECPNCAGRGVK